MKLTTSSLSFATLALALTPASALVLRFDWASPATVRTTDLSATHNRHTDTSNVGQLVRLPDHPTTGHVTDVPFFVTGIQHHEFQKSGKKGGCSGGVRRKAIRISNWFRVKLGMPPIKGHHKHHGGEAPISLRPSPTTSTRPVVMDRYTLVSPHPLHQLHHGHQQSGSFLGRVHQALMTLGPWEGRAVAFVLGCGIGSLLRMIWVLLILTFRSSRSSREVEAEAAFEVLFEEEAESATVAPPPQYTDEKVVVETDTSA